MKTKEKAPIKKRQKAPKSAKSANFSSFYFSNLIFHKGNDIPSILMSIIIIFPHDHERAN